MTSAGGSASAFRDPYEDLAMRTPESRIRAILGTPSRPGLPPVDQQTLARYFEYLQSRLTLPFEAHYALASEATVFPVTVTRLVCPSAANHELIDGLHCEAYLRNRDGQLPLVDIEAPENSPNFAILEDYWYLVWNWREAHCDARPKLSR
jgi:hypothetical protein